MAGIDYLFEKPSNVLGIECRACDGTKMGLQNKGAHVGLYCDDCGTWQKWLSAKDQHKFLKGEK